MEIISEERKRVIEARELLRTARLPTEFRDSQQIFAWCQYMGECAEKFEAAYNDTGEERFAAMMDRTNQQTTVLFNYANALWFHENSMAQREKSTIDAKTVNAPILSNRPYTIGQLDDLVMLGSQRYHAKHNIQ